MKRRDFLKALPALATTLVFPLALTSPAIGKEWSDFIAAEIFQTRDAAIRGWNSQFLALARAFKAGGFKEIVAVQREISYQPDGQCWLAFATAAFR